MVTGTGTVGLAARLGEWVQRLCQIEKPVVNIALGNPYIIQSFPESPTYLCTFSNADVSQTAAVKAVFGEIPLTGKLPVSLPGTAALGDGVQLERLAMQLEATEGSSPVSSKLSQVLDELMSEQLHKNAFPGASIAVGYREQLVFQKAYGNLDYSSSSLPVKTDTVYDLDPSPRSSRRQPWHATDRPWATEAGAPHQPVLPVVHKGRS